MNTWQADLRQMAGDMDNVVTDVEQAGFAVEEYDTLGFPQEHRKKIVAVMENWDDACAHLQYVAGQMLALTERIAHE